MFKKILKVLFIAFLALEANAQDLIVKTNGDEIQGKVLRVGTQEIYFKKKENLDGPEYAELKSNVFFVKYENGQKEIFTTANTPVVKDVSTLCEPIKRKNAVFFEAGGNGMFASINYERKQHDSKRNNFSAIKIGYSPLAVINILNITGTYNIGDGMNFFEIGGGGGLYTQELFNKGSKVFDDESIAPYIYFTPTIGYRRESSKGFLLRTFITMLSIRQEEYNSTYNPRTGTYSDRITYKFERYPFLGVSIGYSF